MVFDETVDEVDVDDLLAYKKVFDGEVEFIDIDFGVKGNMKIQFENQTELSEVTSTFSHFHVPLPPDVIFSFIKPGNRKTPFMWASFGVQKDLAYTQLVFADPEFAEQDLRNAPDVKVPFFARQVS